MKQIQFLLVAFILIATLGCKPPLVISEQNYKEQTFQVAQATNGYTLDMPDVYTTIYKSNLLNLGGLLDTTTIRAIVDSIVLDTLIGFEADEINLVENYNQYRIFKLRYYDLLLRQFLQVEVYEKAKIDSLEVVEYYNSNSEKFAIEEQIELYHILISKDYFVNGEDSLKYRALSDDDLQLVVKKYVDSVSALITTSEKFPEIATQFSEEVSAANSGGYVGWTKRKTYHHPFDSVAFDLRKGDISDPYHDGNGWHIIMANDYYPAGVQPLNEYLYVAAKKDIERTNSNSIGKALIDSLLSDYEVTINPDVINNDMYVLDGQTWVAIINGIDTIDCNEGRSLEVSYREKYKIKNTTPDMKKEIFNRLGERYVLLQSAREIGIEEDSAVTFHRNKLMHKYQKIIVAQNRLDFKWSPSDSTLRQYYDNHLDDFKIDKPLKVQHIIVQDSIFGTFLRDQAMSGVDFMELAQENYPGEESIRTELADLGYISENDVSKEFYEVARKTLVGDVSAPVKTEFGFHIIKVLDFKSSQSFEEARASIEKIFKNEYRENYLKEYQEKLFSKYGVETIKKLSPIHLKPKNMRTY